MKAEKTFMQKENMKVLIINDSSDSPARLSDFLKGTTFDLLISDEGETGLKHAQDMLPDIVLLPLQMPGISGLEICRRLKAEEKTQNIPVIIMIPLSALEAKARVLQAGAADYIAVPLQKEEVLARLALHQRIRNLDGQLCDAKTRLKDEVTQQTTQLAEANKALKQKITERDQALESLQSSERMVKSVLDQSFGLVGLISLDGRVLEANQTALSLIDSGFSDIQNKFFWETPWWAHSPELAKKLQESIDRAAGGEIVRFEATHENALGEIHYIDFSLKPIRNKHKKVFMLLAEGRDISQVKKSSEALAASRNYLDKIINTVADPIFVKDSQHLWVLLNDAFCSFVGHPREKLLGKSDKEFFPKKEVDLFHASDEKVLSTGKESITEEEITIDKGKVRTILANKARYVDGHGNPFIVGIIRDITESKHMEMQLRQAAKMKAIGTLAGGIAHDFNNMLSVILGYAEFALEQPDLSRNLEKALKEIKAAAQRSAEVTRQLLAFARKQTVSPKVLDLNHTVENTLKMLRRIIGEDIHLTWHPANNLCPVKIDPSQIDQILVNLCVNARDAITGVGKLTIETGMVTFDEDYCAYHQDSVPGDFVQLVVSDDGCGMEKETLMNLFEPFFTTKSMDKGTGMGLATVYGIVKQNNGFINVYSEPDVGTTFKIFLPRFKPIEQPLLKNQPTAAKPRESETILLVEDEPAILNMTQMMLEKLGYSVLSAITPRQAIDLAQEHGGEIHLLITDVVMPEMNGRELTRNLLSIYPDLNYLFMSGYTANVIAEHGVLDDGVNFIQKPFSKNELAVKVREALGKEIRHT